MFYLRTGANGSCKTLFTLFDIRKLQLETGRPVAFNSRFKPKPILTEVFGWKLLTDFKKWADEPDGTIFFIDEAYHDLPVRPNGQQPPKYIADLAEHRSRGFDFFLLCLHPSQIDSFVRKAIGAPGWHQHLKRVAGASSLTRQLQWDAVNDQCQKDGSGKTAQIQDRLQPKEVYNWYDSAFLHTGKVRVPRQVWMLLAFVVFASVFGYLGFRYMFKGVATKTEAAVGAVLPPGRSASGVVGSMPINQDKAKVLTTAEYVASFAPRINGLPNSAPRYDALNVPTQAPMPAACIEGVRVGSKASTCKCYTQQATPLAVTPEICHQIAHEGYFDDTLPVHVAAERSALGPVDARKVVPSSRIVSEPADPFKTLDAQPLNPRVESKSTIDRDVQALTLTRKRNYVQ